jgi:hypothetical protein
VDIVDAPGDDADARFDSALRCAQLTENFAEIVDASAHLMALATALLGSARGDSRAGRRLAPVLGRMSPAHAAVRSGLATVPPVAHS